MTHSWESEMLGEFQGFALVGPGATYIWNRDVTAAIQWFKEHRCVILGMDGIEIHQDHFEGPLDYLADFSDISGDWQERVVSSCGAALDIAQRWAEGPLFVEFTIERRDTI